MVGILKYGIMTTVVIENNNVQAQQLLNYISTLPFVKVLAEKDESSVEKPIQWSAKMQRAFAEKEFTKGDINNFWGE